MNAELERFVCWNDEQNGMGAFGDLVDDYYRQSRDLAAQILDAENKTRAAGLYNTYAGNFSEARAALNSMTSILSFWTSDAQLRYQHCLVKNGPNYSQSLRPPFVFTFFPQSTNCLSNITTPMLQSAVDQQVGRIREALSGVRAGAPSGQSAPTDWLTSVLNIFERRSPSGDDDIPAAAPRSTPTVSGATQRLLTQLTQGATRMPDEPGVIAGRCVGYGLETGEVDYNLAATDSVYYACILKYANVSKASLDAEIARLQALKNIVKNNAGTLSTPQPGTVPFKVDASSITGLFNAIGAGWSEIQKARLQAQLLKSYRDKTPIYYRKDAMRGGAYGQPEGAPWPWIIGGLGLLAVGGLVIYAMSGKKRGGAAAPALPASVVPAKV